MQANRQRGEIEAKGHDGTAYLFKLGSNAICILEEKLDRPVLALFEDLQRGKVRMTTLREFVKATSIGRSEPMNNEEASACIDNVGVLPLLDVMTDSLTQTFNPPAEDKANPPTPARRAKQHGAGNSNTPPK